MRFSRYVAILIMIIAIGIVIGAALGIRDRGQPPLEVARGSALLLTAIGAAGIALTRARKIVGRYRGRRNSDGWIVEWLFTSAGGGWFLVLPGALALLALRGDTSFAGFYVVAALALFMVFAVGVGTVAFGFLSMAGSARDVLTFWAIALFPAVVFIALAVRLLAVAWTAA